MLLLVTRAVWPDAGSEKRSVVEPVIAPNYPSEDLTPLAVGSKMMRLSHTSVRPQTPNLYD